ncbi:stalk domain-containing protein [Paenibacillus xanthanilyticus]|uniref:Stalk domain-containing protein n=1 Tax=Paenibacillus xanthanilyticus TaxID=1783531 RepID=A0ABV8KAC5_9BACL
MKDKVKGLVAGLLIGTVVTGATAYAAGGKMIEVFYNVKDIKINKVSKTPSEKPFVLNGTTFVPLRFVAESLGETVKWDSKTATVWIGEQPEATAKYFGDNLSHMNWQSTSEFFMDFNYSYNDKSIKDNVGNTYNNFIKINATYMTGKDSTALLEFPLNGQYKKFVSKLGFTDAEKDSQEIVTFTVLLDDVSVTTRTIKAGEFPTDLNIDVSGAQKIGFKVSKTEHHGSGYEVGLFEARLLK